MLLNFAAKSKAENTVETILLRDAKSDNLTDAQCAIQEINSVGVEQNTVEQERISSYTK